MSRPVSAERAVPLIERFPQSSGRRRAYFYAVGFADGRVKFGKAHQLRGRLRRLCRCDEHAPLWVHAFGTVAGSGMGKACAAEERVWGLAEAHGAIRLGRSEYFRGLSRDAAIHCGRLARLAEFAADASPTEAA